MYRLVPVSLPDVCKAEVSDGDFVPCSKTKCITAKKPGEGEDRDKGEEGEKEDEERNLKINLEMRNSLLKPS